MTALMRSAGIPTLQKDKYRTDRKANQLIMPVTSLDPKTALIVVDLQKGLASFPTVHPMAKVVKNASSLVAAFRRHGLAVVLVNVTGTAPGRAEQMHRGTFPVDFADSAGPDGY